MMEDTKAKKTRTTRKTATNSTRKTQKKTLPEAGEEKQVVEIGLYAHVDLLDYWGTWKPQYIVVDKLMNNWVVGQHWYSKNTNGDQFSQLGNTLIIPASRLRVSSEKCNRPLPWEWYKSMEDFVRFCKSRVGGIGKPRNLKSCELAAYANLITNS